MSVTVSITRTQVVSEVAKTTAYEGAHSGAFDNVYAKSEDKEMLDRYWIEACTMATEVMKEFITSMTAPSPATPNSDYTVTLTMPANFDTNMQNAITNAAYQHFCNYIVGKWLAMIGIEKASAYLASSSNDLAELKNKIYYRIKPTRPS